MQTAAIRDVIADYGETRNTLWRYKAGGQLVDLTGWAARLFLLPKNGDAEIVLDTDSGALILGGLAGTMEIDPGHTDYAELPVGEYRYRLMMIPTDGESYVVALGNWKIR